jgi:hypothetical protein
MVFSLRTFRGPSCYGSLRLKSKQGTSIVSLFILLVLAIPAAADPPGPDDETVLRPDPSAGSDWFGQVQGGLNFTILQGNSAVRQQGGFEQPSSIYKSSTGLGGIVGGSFGYYFTPNFGLMLSGDYDVRYASASANTIDSCLGRSSSGSVVTRLPLPTHKEYSVRADYISLTLVGIYQYQNWQLSIGPSISFPRSGRIQESSDILDDSGSCFYLQDTPDQTRHIVGVNAQQDSLNTRVSIELGVGYIIRLSKKFAIVPQVAFDFGLTHTYSDHQALHTTGDVSGQDIINFPLYNKGITLHALQMTIGFRFNP